MSKEVGYAALLASSYALLAGLYITVSSRLASAASVDLAALEHIETLKGWIFVATTALLLFGGALVLLRRVARHRGELAKAREALLHSERRATAGLLAATVAHDLNNLLAALELGLNELRSLDDAAAREEIAGDLEMASHQAANLAKRLSQAGQTSATGEPHPIDLAATTRDALEVARLHRSVRTCDVELVTTAPAYTEAHPLLVQQMISNLVINAAEACGRGGRVLVRVKASEGAAILEVEDDGPGIPAEERERVFEPFHTTKKEGTGLGLLSVRLCAQLHGARAEVGTSSLGGALFTITFDAERDPSRAANAPGRAATVGAS